MAPAITLKRMYHCVPSSMSAIDPMPRPPPIRTSAMRRIGKKAVAGTEAMICAMGCTTRASRGLRPMATPTGIVHAAEISSATFTRKKVAAAPSSSRRRSARVTSLSMSTACAAAQQTAIAPANANAQRTGETLPDLVSSRGFTTRHSLLCARCRQTGSSTLFQMRPGRVWQILERRMSSRIGDLTCSAASTCSNLNLSLHAMSGRHTS